MLRLTREIRFTLPLSGDALDRHPPNGLAGNLPDGPGVYCVLQVTLAGQPDPASQYVENIKVIDEVVRDQPAAELLQLLRSGKWTLCRATQVVAHRLAQRWHDKLQCVRLQTNPYFFCSICPQEKPMLRLTQRFEFSAAHRLHNPNLDAAANVQLFGKCNNPEGHGHNYEMEVTLAGNVDSSGRLIPPDDFTRTVQRLVIDRFDHKHLNTQTAEFLGVIPSVENIARVVYGLLAGEFEGKLHSVRVWETGKTSAEYSR